MKQYEVEWRNIKNKPLLVTKADLIKINRQREYEDLRVLERHSSLWLSQVAIWAFVIALIIIVAYQQYQIQQLQP